MKKQHLSLILIAVLYLIPGLRTNAQVQLAWEARYNGPIDWEDRATALAVDDIGNVYVTGWSWGIGTNYDWATVKYDADGNTLWTTRYTGPGNYNDRPYAIAVDADQNVYVVGASCVTSTVPYFTTIKYNSQGELLWAATPSNNQPDDAARAVLTDDSGNVFVTGTASLTYYGCDVTTIKYNPSGQQQWMAQYHGVAQSEDDYGIGMALDTNGDLYIVGMATAPNGTMDYATIKYHPNGQQHWAALWNGPTNANDTPVSIALDGNHNIFVTGTTPGIFSYGEDLVTVKYNSFGVEQWERRYDGPVSDRDFAKGLVVDSQGNVIVLGTIDTQPGMFEWRDFLVIKYRGDGEILWERHYGQPTVQDDAVAIALDDLDNIYAVGHNSHEQIITVKYNAAGQLLWQAIYQGEIPASEDAPAAVTVDALHNVYVTGNSRASMTWNDFTTLKYVQPVPQVAITLDPLNPPIVIPAWGGSFNYNITVANNDTIPVEFDTWIMVQRPDLTWYGPLYGPINLSLSPGQSLSRIRTQNVPFSAPPGTYHYRGLVGDFPDAWDFAGFVFWKLYDRSGPHVTDWSNTGEDLATKLDNQLLHDSNLNVFIRPNPFNPTTTIHYQLSTASYVRLTVWDTAGRVIFTLVNGMRDAGFHELTFDGAKLSSGIYIYSMQAGAQSARGKLILLK